MSNTDSTTTTKVIVVTGLSGAGKTVALNAFEDSGYYCVDHLPGDVLIPTLQSLKRKGVGKIAVGLDPWDKSFLLNASAHWEVAAQEGFDIRLLVLTARIDVLQRRYSESRRKHPLAVKNRSVGDAITLESRILKRVPPGAFSIDTSDMSPTVLKDRVKAFMGESTTQMAVVIESFGFKHNLPVNADLVYDVRCLPNPHYVADLKHQSGLDPDVIAYFKQHSCVERMIDSIVAFIDCWKADYEKDHRSYLTIGVGCTGGQHRSVYVAACVAEKLARLGTTSHVRHRESGRWNKSKQTT